MSIFDRAKAAFTAELATRVEPAMPPDNFGTRDQFPGPGQPPVTVGQMAQNPRSFDYDYSSNAQFQPRAEFPQIPNFAHLDGIYYKTEEFRIGEEYVWGEVNAVPSEIIYRKGSPKPKDIDKMNWLENLLENPDPLTGWDKRQWTLALGCASEHYDATTIYPVKNRMGEVIALQQVDGSTIKPLIGDKGYAPAAPQAFIEQFIHGAPYAKFTRDEIIYHPFNARTPITYGKPALEDLMFRMTRLYLQGKWEQDKYTEGNIPHAFAVMRETFKIAAGQAGTNQILDLQKAMDAVSGMTAKRHRLFIMPPFIDDIKPLNADAKFDKELPEYEVKWFCLRMGIPPHIFATSANRATAKEHGEQLVHGKHKERILKMESLWAKVLRFLDCDEYRVIYRQPRNLEMVHIQGIVLAMSTPLPVTEDNPLGLPALSRTEGRKEIGYEDDPDDLSIEDAELNPSDNDQIQDAEVVQPQLEAGAAVEPVAATDEPVNKSFAGAPRNRLALSHRAHAAQAPIVGKFMGSLRKSLASNRDKVISQAAEAARKRGLKVVK